MSTKLPLILFAIGAFRLAAQSAPAPKPAEILATLDGMDVLATLRWQAGVAKSVELPCLVTRDTAGPQLRIFRPGLRHYDLLVSYRAGREFIGLFTTAAAGGQLVTVWAGEKSRQLVIFSHQNDDVVSVLDLEIENEAWPEFVAAGGDAGPVLLIARTPKASVVNSKTGKAGKAAPTRLADIYLWNGKKYLLSRTVDWRNRLQAASGLK